MADKENMSATEYANLSCEERVEGELSGRLEDLRRLWEAYKEDPDAYVEDLGRMYDYGLAFDYVTPDTYDDIDLGFFRYQLSTGGPGDEFRFFLDSGNNVERIQYVFQDWFDGATADLTAEDFELLEEIFQMMFVDSGTAKHEYEKAVPKTDLHGFSYEQGIHGIPHIA